jgi:hypothetical protein
MKSNSIKLAVLSMTVVVLLGASNSGFAQPTLTVTPSATSNTYAGVVTLNITGLTNGETVLIQKYLDLNANGAIDAGEPLMDAFRISDGGVMVIGGITNINVPFDSNTATGAITTALNFPVGMVLENIVGRQIIQLVSPTASFTSTNTTFTVTNTVLSQYVSGTVFSNGVPLPNAVVVAQDLEANNPVASAVADNSGHYFFTLQPGNYGLVAGMPNLYFDQSLAPTVTLTNGASATNNLYLTNGTVTISGTVFDAANSNTLGGVMLLFESGDYFAINFTDANGNYSAALTPSFWKIEPVKERLGRRALLQPENTLQVDTTTGAVASVGIALPKGTALFYGRITDDSNAPFANIQLDGGAGNKLGGRGYSDANGNYAVAVVGDQTNYWSCSASSSQSSALGHYVVNSFGSMTLSNNQAVQLNFVALPAIGTISGRVKDKAGNPVSGVTLTDQAVIGGASYESQESTTDNQGNYSFGVAAGQWTLQFLNGGGSQDNLDAHGFVDLSGPHIVNVPPTNVVLNFTVYPLGTPVLSGLQRIAPTQLGFLVTGSSNVNYTVQYSTNLASTNWFSLLSFQLTTNPFPVVDTQATNKQRFYRAQKN